MSSSVSKIDNIHILSQTPLPLPAECKKKFPISESGRAWIAQTRSKIQGILQGKSAQKFLVVGPCSIHRIDESKEYARRLLDLSKKVEDRIVLLMRVYFEKPRTTVGWKGFINDPYLDDSFQITEGIQMAREFLVELAENQLGVGSEALDPLMPQYIGELWSWVAIGARTTESQTHREMASGLSAPVGFKNATDGNLDVAINALQSARHPHRFLGVNSEGLPAVYHTQGNPDGHMILRGGKSPNYHEEEVMRCRDLMLKAGLNPAILVDCSHGNSKKNFQNQGSVFRNVLTQWKKSNSPIVGVMLESNLVEGKQDLSSTKEGLVEGQSITDSCIGWDETEALILEAYRDFV